MTLTSRIILTMLLAAHHCLCQLSAAAESPSETVQQFYAAANAGRYSQAEKLIATDFLRVIKGELGAMAGGFKGICDKETKHGTISKVEIINERIRGEGAIVVTRIRYMDGTTKENDKTDLIFENGSWKITAGDSDTAPAAKPKSSLPRSDQFVRPGASEAQEVERANREIDAVYQKLMSTLPPEKQTRLRNAQRAWIKERDAQAERIARDGGAIGGSALRVDFLTAQAKLIRERTELLKGYLKNPSSVP